ncbi:hypothetical protein ABZX95_45850 [Streptomyces sp. NPDC004232]
MAGYSASAAAALALTQTLRLQLAAQGVLLERENAALPTDLR